MLAAVFPAMAMASAAVFTAVAMARRFAGSRTWDDRARRDIVEACCGADCRACDVGADEGSSPAAQPLQIRAELCNHSGLRGLNVLSDH